MQIFEETWWMKKEFVAVAAAAAAHTRARIQRKWHEKKNGEQNGRKSINEKESKRGIDVAIKDDGWVEKKF